MRYLQHTHIVQIFDSGEHEGMPFIVLEFCTAGSLAEHLKTVRPDWLQAAGLVEVLAHAVAAAHRNGLIHRDLKPTAVSPLVAEGTGGAASAESCRR